MTNSKILVHTSEYKGRSTVVCFDIDRINIYTKLHVCKSIVEMEKVITNMIQEKKFNYSSIIPFTMLDNIKSYLS